MKFIENELFKRKEEFFIKIEMNEEGYIEFKKINQDNTETLLNLSKENKNYLLETGNFHNKISVCSYFALTENEIDYFIYRYDSIESKKAIKNYYIKTSSLKIGDVFKEDRGNGRYIFLGYFKNNKLKITPRYYVMEIKEDNRLIYSVKQLFVTDVEGSDEYFSKVENTKKVLEDSIRRKFFFNSEQGGVIE